MGVRIVIAVAGALSVIFAPTRAHPSAWYVDASVARSGDGKSWQTAFKAIQEGINAASAGDTVTVAAGTYLTNVRFNGKNIVLRSRQPSNPDAVADTIIDGGRYGPVVKFSGGEDPTCVLSGFTIRNGSADNGGGICGGTPGQPTHATISGNVITDNRAVAVWPDGQGGGVAYCDGLVERNRIVANLARHGGGLSRCNGTIRNNVIVGNSAEQNGGGLHLCGGTVELNTVVRNFASLGGGLDSCRGVIRNCIIWGNGGGSQLCDCSVPDYSCIGSWTGGGTGNLSYNPYFVDASHGDYHLTSWSPCIDAGDPGSPFSEEPPPNGGRVNMGAYGNTPEATCASSDLDSDGLPDAYELKHFGNLGENPDGDPDGDNISTGDEYFWGLDPTNPAVTWYVDGFAGNSGEGRSWETAFCTVQEGIDAATGNDTVIVGPGLYTENIFMSGKNLVFQSADPLDPTVVANTVIDGGFAGSVVVFDGTEDERCVLAGFTIRNGQAFYGGGIRGEGTRAAIRNNIIANNLAEWHGGGVSGCDGFIENNTVSGNGAFEGAGLAYCGGTIRDNIITGNTAEGDGGGLYGCSATFERNEVSVNAAIGGGGLAACEGVFRFNTITDNSAEENGGAFAWCSGIFANNVVWENTAAGQGGGFFGCEGEFHNNTVAWNSAQLGGGLSQCYGTILNCIIWGNSGEAPLHDSDTPRYCCIEDWPGGGEGNIDYNPYFVDEENGDFHLKPCSPCIDAGDPDSPFSNEPLPNGGRIDLGAYGNTSEATSRSPDTDSDGLPDDWEMEWFGTLSHDGDDDPDSDEIPNLIEYLYATPPNVAGTRNIVRNVTAKRWFSTIQAALSGAADGDELVVYPGHYVENIHFDGKNIVLRSLDPQDPAIVADTVIDGNQSGSVVTFAGTENESCVLDGFTIRNGTSNVGGGIRGGEEYSPTHATIQNNVITANSAAFGGGIFACDGIVQSNIITDNLATQDGGGVAFCDGVIQDNVIRGNRADRDGGGEASSSGTIQNNVIEANSAGRDAGALYGCDGTIQGNRISANSCGGSGGGLLRCHGTIRNNVITGNSARHNGGGMGWCWGTIESNTVVGNSAVYSGGGIDYSQATIRNCIIWRNEAANGSQVYGSSDPTYSCIEGWTGGGDGNISYYPYFVDAQGGDYHLKDYSPCIDAGDPASDFSNEPQPNGGRINMGAYGNTPEATCASPDSDSDGLPDDWEIEFIGNLAQGPDDDPDEDNLSNLEEYRQGTDPTLVSGWHVDDSVAQTGDGTSWSKAFKTIREGIAAASNGDTVVVAPGTYYENIHFQGKNLILRSTRPDNAEIVASTIIDGQRLRAVVTFDGAEDETCILWGFTIQRGNAPSGGGVYGDGTTATIRGNIFTANSATAGAALYSCDGIIERNVVSESSDPALVLCNGIVRNNIICRNADSGLYACAGIIENNTIFGNKRGITSCKGVIRNCVLWGNTEYQISDCSQPTYSCIEGPNGGQGNITYNPHFEDAEGGNFHLLSWSPCIDAGDPSCDFSNEPQPNGGRINMGAYGNTPEATCASPDNDGDGLPDDWEMHFFGNLVHKPSDDTDGDGMSNVDEYHAGRSPSQPFKILWHVDGSLAASGDGKSWATAFRTIQEAIDASSDEDAITVAQGTYTENIHFDSKNIVLRSTDPLDLAVVENTVIDGGQLGSVVTFSGTEDETCMLSGFTIRNGKAGYGGGICGGAYQNRARAGIVDNIIEGNFAGSGGGLSFCNGRIQGNVIRQNEDGGAESLYLCDGPIQNNIVRGDLAWCDGQIQNNLLYGLAHCNGTLHNNTIIGKLYGCLGTIRNCIIWGSRSPEHGLLEDSSIPTYSCIRDWVEGGEGNISEDPRFVDAAGGDYRLQQDSPCIDSGANYYWFSWPENDLEGNCRIAGERVDMGCYEYGAAPDSDGDLLSDADEAEAGTDPLRDDSDGDGLRDGLEVLRGSDPLTPTAPRSLYVPSDSASIQVALCLAVDGDEIVVSSGIYYENLQFCGADVVLRSSDPGRPEIVDSTILDGCARAPVVSFSGCETAACLLAGFTIRNGRSSRGGGIRGSAGAYPCQATIENNIITHNSAPGTYGWGGGLTFCDGLIRGNVITANSAERHGGLSGCNGLIQSNVISHNSARDIGGGLAECHGPIMNNVIVHNSAGGDGGGLYDCNGRIENNVISANQGQRGAGLDNCEGIIRNCIMWANIGGFMPQVGDRCHPVFSCIQNWTEAGEGNISGYPHFVDPEGGDYHLRTWSPCIDAGDPASDFMNEPQPNGGRINMGAYGNTPEAASASPDSDGDGLPDDWEIHFFGDLSYGTSDDADGDGRSNIEEYQRGTNPAVVLTWYVSAAVNASGDGTSPETAFKTVQQGMDAASGDDVVLVAEGVYVENIHFNSKNICVTSTNPLDLGTVANTILDGGREGPVVTFAGTEDADCVLSGFTIRNGLADGGGGIAGKNAHATIRNCVITGNWSTTYGGGLYACDGAILNNTVSGNSADDDGGGLSACQGLIRNNVIAENSANGLGGGLDRCNGEIRNNIVTGNSADDGGGGLYWCKGEIHNNIITGNSADDDGGGLAWCDATIENNTIAYNSAADRGGGLYSCQGTLQNCIIWRNTAANGSQSYASVTPTYSCIENWTGSGEGNIPEDPRFLDPDEGDFRLGADSPCIDAGKNEDWMEDAVDLDGKPRILFGNSSMTVDMGAYEYGSVFKLVHLEKTGGEGLGLKWNSRPGDLYTVWSCPDLLNGTWTQEAIVPSQGETTVWSDPDTSSAWKFYKIQLNGAV